jgi:hypothetical protein
MRFVFIVKSAHRGPPSPALMEAMHKLADRKAGRMLDNGGPMPLATGAQVRITDRELSVVDRPFVEAKGSLAATRSSSCATRRRPRHRRNSSQGWSAARLRGLMLAADLVFLSASADSFIGILPGCSCA